jgi:hypothetical protein
MNVNLLKFGNLGQRDPSGMIKQVTLSETGFDSMKLV